VNLKRFRASTMRDAIKAVRTELGPDAVILSRSRRDEGVEIVALADCDEALLRGLAEQEAQPAAPRPAPVAPTLADAGVGQPPRATPAIEARPSLASAAPSTIAFAESPRHPLRSPRIGGMGSDLVATTPAELRAELSALRSLIERHISGLAWGELGRRQPHRARLMEQLLTLGLEPRLCHEVAQQVGEIQGFDAAWQSALEVLVRQLRHLGDEILTQGGVVALIGPTGVGKTTTVAKLAAQHILRHGPGSVGLITTDGYRIGTQEQLRAFGRILDIPVAYAPNKRELAAHLDQFSDRKLVLVDTQGIGPHDTRLIQHLGLLDGEVARRLRCYVVVAANTQLAGQRDVVTAFQRLPLHGAIVTKVDEAASLGNIISILITSGLALTYITDGQQVPDDLRPADPRELLRAALAVMRQGASASDEETHAFTFGRMVAGLHG
jgi:flagellar biosynthesis protein FlhF